MTTNREATWMKKTSGYLDAFQSAGGLQVITEVIDYLKLAQVEETKRQMIAAQRDVLVRAIESEKELIEKYFQERFRERATALGELFTMLRSAVDKGDITIVDRTLAAILGILQDSPLRDLENFRSWFYSPDPEPIEL